MISDEDLKLLAEREITPQAIKVFHNNPRTGVFDIHDVSLGEMSEELLLLRGKGVWHNYCSKDKPPIDTSVLVKYNDGEVGVDWVNADGKWMFCGYNVPDLWMPIPPFDVL